MVYDLSKVIILSMFLLSGFDIHSSYLFHLLEKPLLFDTRETKNRNGVEKSMNANGHQAQEIGLTNSSFL